jgi:hypothetical protein
LEVDLGPNSSLSLPLARQVGWCCGRVVRRYVLRDVFVIYIHFVCWLVCLFFLLEGGVVLSVTHSLRAGEFCPSVSIIIMLRGEGERGRERDRNNRRVEFFYVVCLWI